MFANYFEQITARIPYSVYFENSGSDRKTAYHIDLDIEHPLDSKKNF